MEEGSVPLLFCLCSPVSTPQSLRQSVLRSTPSQSSHSHSVLGAGQIQPCRYAYRTRDLPLRTESKRRNSFVNHGHDHSDSCVFSYVR